jgi:hypothetical protein
VLKEQHIADVQSRSVFVIQARPFINPGYKRAGIKKRFSLQGLQIYMAKTSCHFPDIRQD